jgi:hypothetical protein
MENVTTISQEELAKITELQEQYAEITAKLGQVHIEQLNLKIYQNTLETNYQALKEQENALGQELNAKYGDGTLNLQTGEFTASK